MGSRKNQTFTKDDIELLRSLSANVSQLEMPSCIRPEFLAGIIDPKLLISTTPFRGGAYEDLRTFVEGHTGLSEEEFKAEGRKSLQEMYDEWRIADMDLAAKNGHLIRLATNVRTEIHCPHEGVSLQEDSRDFLDEDGNIIPSKRLQHIPRKPYGSSETMRLGRGTKGDESVGEAAVLAAWRGIMQEYVIDYPIEWIRLLATSASAPDIHTSTVFARTISVVISWHCRIDLYATSEWGGDGIIEHPDNKEYVTIRDGNVLVNHLWRRPQT
jgi:hypothetical protein